MVNEVMDFIEQCDPEVGQAINRKLPGKDEIWN